MNLIHVSLIQAPHKQFSSPRIAEKWKTNFHKRFQLAYDLELFLKVNKYLISLYMSHAIKT